MVPETWEVQVQVLAYLVALCEDLLFGLQITQFQVFY